MRTFEVRPSGFFSYDHSQEPITKNTQVVELGPMLDLLEKIKNHSLQYLGEDYYNSENLYAINKILREHGRL